MEDWAALRWIVLGCALLVAPVYAAWNGWTYWQLRADGVETNGVVSWKTWRGWRNNDTYLVEYRFRDNAGRLHYATQRGLSYPVYRSLRVGQPITVTYSRSNPEANAVYLNALWEQVATQSLISLLIGICAGSATWWWTYAERETREYHAVVRRIPA
jgi:hypothetical protein